MVLTNNVPSKESELLIGSNPTSPIYISLGDTTSTPSRASTSMVNEVTRFIATTTSATSGVSYIQGELKSVGSYDTYSELGRFDETTAGIMYDRDILNPIEHTSNVNTRVTMFNSVIANNTNKSIVTDAGILEIAEWFANTSITPYTHIAWGSLLILDNCDSLGVGPNDWQDSADASAAALDTTNFQEKGASIKLGKTGTGGATFSYTRTLAATVDGSSATEFAIWLNPVIATDYDKLASTDALELRIGSDSSNYKSIKFDRAELIVGWQRLKVTISDMTDTSSPDMSALDYLSVILKTTNASDTITSGNILMDYWTLTWPLVSTETTLREERFREAASTSAVANQSIFKKTVDKSEGTSSTLNYVGLFSDSTAGTMFFVNEITNTKKSERNRLIQEVKLGFGF